MDPASIVPLMITCLTMWAKICSAYCPRNCTCQEHHTPKILEIFSNMLDITDVNCQLAEDGFNINREAERIMANRNTTQYLSLIVKCKDGVNVTWTSAKFLKYSVGLSVINCNLNQNRGKDIVFPQITRLKFLFFKNNGGEKFFQDVEFRGIRELGQLVLRNGLTKIPASLQEYSMLMFSLFNLDLTSNKLAQIPCNFISNFFSLQMLSLRSNGVRTIPSCICTNSQLHSLDLDDNEITDISNLMCGTQPRQLSLALNKITHLKPFPRQSELMTIDLSFNEITKISTNTFADLPMVQTINLNHNRINEIEPFAFGSLPRLFLLYLNNNQLTNYQMNMAPKPGLRMTFVDLSIYLGENNLKYPPYHNNNYFFPHNFKTYAAYNQYQCDCEMEMYQNAKKDGKLAGLVGQDQLTCKTPPVMHEKTIMSLNFNESCLVIEGCPSSCLCRRNQTDHVTHVDCSSKNLLKLPEAMPNGAIALDLHANRITKLIEKKYFDRILKLDASDNQIGEVSELSLIKLVAVTSLRLNGNKIQTLPRTVESWKPLNLTELLLYDNPWLCSCKTLWLKTWLVSQGGFLQHPDKTRCYDGDQQGEAITRVLIDCYDYKPLAISMSILAVILVVCSVLIYLYRMEIKLLLYTHFQWHPFDKTKISDKKYDAFISYSEEDSHWVHNELVKLLEEDHKPPFHTCFHHRDFLPGAPIAENIQKAVEDSQCTIIVLTPSFLESEWCIFEFQVAHNCMINREIAKVIILIKEEVDMKNIDPELRSYLRTMTYLETTDKWFEKKLYYSLPQRKLTDEEEMVPLNV